MAGTISNLFNDIPSAITSCMCMTPGHPDLVLHHPWLDSYWLVATTAPDTLSTTLATTAIPNNS